MTEKAIMDARRNLTLSLVLSALLALPVCAEDAPPATSENSPTTPSAAVEFTPGPLLDARKSLMEDIKKAKARGVGIAGYMTAFQAIEEQVKAGTPTEQITPRIDSVKRSLADQLKRSDVLKTQKPIPPQGSQLSGGGGISTSVGSSAPSGGGAGKGSTDPTIAKLKEKFGDIPEDQIPAGLKDKLKDPAVLQKLKEKFGG